MKSATYGLFVFLALGTAGAVTTSTVLAQATTTSTKGEVKKAGKKTKKAVKTTGEVAKEGVSKSGEVITDGWITTRVHSKFLDEKLLKGSDIDVDTKDHVVTLKGTVTSAAARARAAEQAKEVEGVHRVVNHLTIGPKK
jgi:hyperosmotically inducible periplasmic protein